MKAEKLENGYVRLRAETGHKLFHLYMPEQRYSEAVVREAEVPRFSETGGVETQ